MSPVPASDAIDLNEEPKGKSAARAVPAKGGAEVEISLPKTVIKGDMPLIRARVLYLGPAENFSIAMPGQIHETYLEDPDGTVTRRDRSTEDDEGTMILGKERRYTVLKEAVASGITQYVFETRDVRGHLIKDSLAPAHYEERYRNRPFVWCEHVGHLRNFFMAKDERGEELYHIKVNPQQAQLLTEHIRRSERARRQQDQLFAEVAGR